MSLKSEYPKTRRHIHIYDSDWDFITSFFSPTGPHPIGVSTFIRECIHKKVEEIRAKQRNLIDKGAHRS